MNNYFFSKENVVKLSVKLSKNLKIKDTPESMNACREFLKKQMKIVYAKYGDKKPKGVPIPDFINKLNEKSLDDCIKLYKKQTAGKKPPAKNISDYQMSRDKELNGGRNPGLMRRPTHTSGLKENNGFPGMLDSGGASGFAPLVTGNAGFITASGELGDNMMPSNSAVEISSNKGDAAKEELEKRMMMRKAEYDSRPGNMNMNNMSNTNTNNAGMGDMGMMGCGTGDMNFGNFESFLGQSQQNPSNGPEKKNGIGFDIRGGGFGGYNPNINNNNQKPPEINFCLDGGDSRQTKLKTQMNSQMGEMGNMGNSMDPMGFSAFGGTSDFTQNNTNFGNMSMQPHNNMIMPNNNMPMQPHNMMMPHNGMSHNSMMMPPNNGMSMHLNNNGQITPQNNGMPTQHNMNTALTGDDIKKRMSQIMQDRNNITIAKQPGSFNPMMSPSLIGNMPTHQPNKNPNFSKVGSGIDFGTMSSMELQKYLSETKQSTPVMPVTDLKKIQNMSLEELEEMIDKKQMAIDPNYKPKHKPNNTTVKKHKPTRSKEQILNIMKQIHREKNNSPTNNEQKGKNILNIQKTPVKSNIKIKTNDNVYIDKDMIDMNLSDDKKDEPTPKKKVEFVTKVNKIKTIKYTIDAKDVTEPAFYNDYMIDLDDVALYNVTAIEMVNYKFPNTNPKIDNTHNQFKFVHNDEEKVVELANGNYELDEIVEAIQSVFDQEETNIKIDITSDNKCVIESADRSTFSLINDDASIMKLLGFDKSVYDNSYIHISNGKHKFNNKIYMYIDNISLTEPFAVIDMNNTQKTFKKKYSSPIPELKELVLKFKPIETPDDILCEFNNEPHRITFNFETSQTENKSLSK